MRRLAQPHFILFIMIFFFCSIANNQATIMTLEKKNMMLDERLFEKMHTIYKRMFLEKKLTNQLLKEYYKYHNF